MRRWHVTGYVAASLLVAVVVGAAVLQVQEAVEMRGTGDNYDDPCFWQHNTDSAKVLACITSKDKGQSECWLLEEPLTDPPRVGDAVIPGTKANNCDFDQTRNEMLTTDNSNQTVVVHDATAIAAASSGQDISNIRVISGAEWGAGDPDDITGICAGRGGECSEDSSKLCDQDSDCTGTCTNIKNMAFVTDEADDDVIVVDHVNQTYVRKWDHGLAKAEGIACDDDFQRVYVCDDQSNARGCRAFDYKGNLIGHEFGCDEGEDATCDDVFGSDAEGVTVYKCNTGSTYDGYIVVSDQGSDEYEVFDRIPDCEGGTNDGQACVTDSDCPSGYCTFDWYGTFELFLGSDKVTDDDGITIIQSTAFPNGIFGACDICVSGSNNELDIARWDNIAQAFTPDLDVCPNGSTAAVCGDNTKEGAEECDGTDDTACPGLCLSTCVCAVCGDNSINVGTCAGGAQQGNPCTEDADCPLSTCTFSEACDGTADTACPGACQGNCTCGPFCGDNNVNQSSEQCDGTDDTQCAGLCLENCTCPGCSDCPNDCTALLADLRKDLANTVLLLRSDIGSIDAFTSGGGTDPQVVCGNNTLEPTNNEECDGTDDDACPDQCTATCTCPSPSETCGDGTVDSEEECDPGKICQGGTNDGQPCAIAADCPGGTCPSADSSTCDTPADGCKTDCTCVGSDTPRCGDNTVDAGRGEECDGTDDSACPNLCLNDCTCDETQPANCDTAMTLPDACVAGGGRDGAPAYPYSFDGGGDAWCITGGCVVGTCPYNASWNTCSKSPNNAAFAINDSPAFTLTNFVASNVGDGIRPRDNVQGWTIDGANLSYIRDDCIEDDHQFGGTVDDSLFSGCYVFLSTRRGAGWDTTGKHCVGGANDGKCCGGSGSCNTTCTGGSCDWSVVTVKNSLIYMQPYPGPDSGPDPGHGPVFKTENGSDTSPEHTLTNNYFVLQQMCSHGNCGVPGDPAGDKLWKCSGNTLVWGGSSLGGGGICTGGSNEGNSCTQDSNCPSSATETGYCRPGYWPERWCSEGGSACNTDGDCTGTCDVCFSHTTDSSVWTQVVLAWLQSHGYQ